MNSQQSLSAYLEKLVRESLQLLRTQYAAQLLSDLYWQVDLSTGTFAVIDDNQHQILKNSVKEWVADDDEKNVSLRQVEHILRDIVHKLKDEDFTQGLNIQTPFSILMVDEEMEILCELFFLDEDTVPLDENIMQRIDNELDDFIKQLMKD